MRKRVTPATPAMEPTRSTGAEDWLDLERLATIELASEDASHPIEAALRPGDAGGGT